MRFAGQSDRFRSEKGIEVAMKRVISAATLLLGALLASSAVHSATLQVVVKSDGEKPVEDAVVYATPLEANGLPAPPTEPTAVDQIDKEYIPYVTAVQVGTKVLFPNHDPIRHHLARS